MISDNTTDSSLPISPRPNDISYDQLTLSRWSSPPPWCTSARRGIIRVFVRHEHVGQQERRRRHHGPTIPIRPRAPTTAGTAMFRSSLEATQRNTEVLDEPRKCERCSASAAVSRRRRRASSPGTSPQETSARASTHLTGVTTSPPTWLRISRQSLRQAAGTGGLADYVNEQAGLIPRDLPGQNSAAIPAVDALGGVALVRDGGPSSSSASPASASQIGISSPTVLASHPVHVGAACSRDRQHCGTADRPMQATMLRTVPPRPLTVQACAPDHAESMPPSDLNKKRSFPKEILFPDGSLPGSLLSPRSARLRSAGDGNIPQSDLSGLWPR